MSFQEAISDGLSKYVQFEGRSSRSAYWYWALFAFIVSVVAYAISAALGTLLPYIVVALAMFLPGLAVAVRRLHDTGKSGWFILIGIIPFGGFVVLFFLLQPSGPANAYGAGPDNAGSVPAPAF